MDALEIVVSTMRILSLTSISCIGTQFCALCLLIRTLVRALNDELRVCLQKALKGGAADEKKTESAVSRRLLDLRMVFARVYDVCGEINNVFGIFVLLILTYHNTFIHVEVFHICAQVIDSTLVQSTWKFAHSKEALWAVINIVKILAFFVCCALVLTEVG
jgi:7tm Chemosensory receptor